MGGQALPKLPPGDRWQPKLDQRGVAGRAEIYCVRADGGKYAEAFKAGGYVAYGWEHNADLTACITKEQIQAQYQARVSRPS